MIRPDITHRLQSVDALRGTIMILMVIDHVRDFVDRDAQHFNPTDLKQTFAALFLTRWITHFCAPTFLFLAGAGAFLWLQRGRTVPQLSRYLATRGLWLIVVELVIMRLSFNFGLGLEAPIFLIILWALGGSMILLAALVYLPRPALTILSLGFILIHNAFDRIDPQSLGAFSPLWTIFMKPGALEPRGVLIVLAYPLLPWAAIMAAGFCFGPLLLRPDPERKRIVLRLGLGCVAGFLMLRLFNGFGDPAPWLRQLTPGFTLLSFLNTTKQPPSLIFDLMILGPALLWLRFLDGRHLRPANPLLVFGRVPLFFFVAHFYLAHAFADILLLLRYGRAALPLLLHPVPAFGGNPARFPSDFGSPLWVTYAVWLLVLICLYPLCRWFGKVKATRKNWWLSYL